MYRSMCKREDVVSFLDRQFKECAEEPYENNRLLKSYNLDSLDYAALAAETEEKFGLHISNERLGIIKSKFTAGRLADYIHKRAKKRAA